MPQVLSLATWPLLVASVASQYREAAAPTQIVSEDVVPLWQALQSGLLEGRAPVAEALDLALVVVPKLDFRGQTVLPDGSRHTRFPGGGARAGLNVATSAEGVERWTLHVQGPAHPDLAALDAANRVADVELQIAHRDGEVLWVSFFAMNQVHHSAAVAASIEERAAISALRIGGYVTHRQGATTWKPIELSVEPAGAGTAEEVWSTSVGQPVTLYEGDLREAEAVAEVLQLVPKLRGLQLWFFGVTVLCSTAVPAPAPVTPTAALGEGECCLCVGTLDKNGEILMACRCRTSFGGLSCSITSEGCQTPGTCTSGGGG